MCIPFQSTFLSILIHPIFLKSHVLHPLKALFSSVMRHYCRDIPADCYFCQKTAELLTKTTFIFHKIIILFGSTEGWFLQINSSYTMFRPFQLQGKTYNRSNLRVFGGSRPSPTPRTMRGLGESKRGNSLIMDLPSARTLQINSLFDASLRIVPVAG